MRIKILKGTNEIGGTCVELSHFGTTILLDIGLPLNADSKPVNVEELTPDAVLVSHPHPDHYGLIEPLDSSVPVYMGELAKRLIDATLLFTGKELLKNNFHFYKPWESFQVGSFNITPYLVDHSAVDAYAFLIEAEGIRIFYSGDFRVHGRKSKVLEKLIQNPPQSIDLLLMEGTMLGRSNEDFPDEKSVEDEIVNVLNKESGPCFLLSSSQNIDRMVSVYRASKRAGRIFVVDIYTAWILRELSEFFSTILTINWDDIRVLSKGWTARNHYLRVKENPDYFEGFVQKLYKKGNVITHQEIANNPKKYFIKSNYIEGLMEEISCDHSSVIYSLWKGYMEEEHNLKGYVRLQKLQQNSKIHFIYVHTSGHAVLKDLKRFADTLSPKILVPIHTEYKNLYTEYFENVMVLEDGQSITV